MSSLCALRLASCDVLCSEGVESRKGGTLLPFQGEGKGSSAVVETALTMHAWLLVPAIQTNNYSTGCKPSELKVCLPPALYTTDFSSGSLPVV